MRERRLRWRASLCGLALVFGLALVWLAAAGPSDWTAVGADLVEGRRLGAASVHVRDGARVAWAALGDGGFGGRLLGPEFRLETAPGTVVSREGESVVWIAGAGVVRASSLRLALGPHEVRVAGVVEVRRWPDEGTEGVGLRVLAGQAWVDRRRYPAGSALNLSSADAREEPFEWTPPRPPPPADRLRWARELGEARAALPRVAFDLMESLRVLAPTSPIVVDAYLSAEAAILDQYPEFALRPPGRARQAALRLMVERLPGDRLLRLLSAAELSDLAALRPSSRARGRREPQLEAALADLARRAETTGVSVRIRPRPNPPALSRAIASAWSLARGGRPEPLEQLATLLPGPLAVEAWSVGALLPATLGSCYATNDSEIVRWLGRLVCEPPAEGWSAPVTAAERWLAGGDSSGRSRRALAVSSELDRSDAAVLLDAWGRAGFSLEDLARAGGAPDARDAQVEGALIARCAEVLEHPEWVGQPRVVALEGQRVALRASLERHVLDPRRPVDTNLLEAASQVPTTAVVERLVAAAAEGDPDAAVWLAARLGPLPDASQDWPRRWARIAPTWRAAGRPLDELRCPLQ